MSGNGFRKLGVIKTGKGFDNSDLRLINIKKEDELFYRHKIFVVQYQRASSTQEVARRLGMTVDAVMQKASYLRSQGLKMLKRFYLTDQEVVELKRLAEQTAPKRTVFDEKREKILAWNKAKSVKEFAKKYRMTAREAGLWSGGMRGNGFALKKFIPRGREVNGRA